MESLPLLWRGAPERVPAHIKQLRKVFVSEYNRLISEAKSVLVRDPYIKALKPLSYGGNRNQSDAAVATAAENLQQILSKIKSSPGVEDSSLRVEDSSTYTPMDYLPYSGRFSPAALELEKLLGCRFSPDATDESGWTDLHYAAALNLPGLASALLEAGAAPDARLKGDNKALNDTVIATFSALSREFKSAEDKKIPIRDGSTPLHVAARHNADLAAVLLIANDAKIGAETSMGYAPMCLAASPEFSCRRGVSHRTRRRCRGESTRRVDTA